MAEVKKVTSGPYKLIGGENTGIINAGIVSKEQAVEEARAYANRAGVMVTVKGAGSVDVVTIWPPV